MDNYKEVKFEPYCSQCVNKDISECEEPCNECLGEYARENTAIPLHFKSSKDGISKEFMEGYPKKITKLEPHLYLATYGGLGDLDYESAWKYFAKNGSAIQGCSALRKGNLCGGNFDWTYDHSAEFIVKTNTSIGIAGAFPELTEDFVKSGEYSELYKILPFQILDGINKAGVYVKTNVVPMDKGPNRTIPDIELMHTISANMLNRFILDNFFSAEEAVCYIRKYVSVFFPESLHKLGYECHFFVCDRQKSFCLEFKDNKAYALDISSKPIVTNFNLLDVIFNADGTVYTPLTKSMDDEKDAQAVNNVTPHGSGLERYNYIVEHPSMDIYDTLRNLRYTRTYVTSERPADPFWYTEFVGGELTCSSKVEDFNNAVYTAGEAYCKRSRDDAKTWQTVHTTVYDLDDLSVCIYPQEKDIPYRFKLH